MFVVVFEWVGGVLVVSVLMMVVGFGMMFFVDFGKFWDSGLVIVFCLLIIFVVCVILVLVLFCGYGCFVFWFGIVLLSEVVES